MTAERNRILFSASELEQIIPGAQIHPPAEQKGADLEFSGVSIDSRSCSEGDLFVPLAGTRTDGHLFIPAAAERGVAASLVAESVMQKEGRSMRRAAGKAGAALIVVDNPLTALQRLAGAYLDRFPDLVRIGITGSNGKTTTKEMVGSILRLQKETLVTEGNLNSEIGLPLSVFNLRSRHSYAVFEMGMNRPGEMDILAEIVRPDIALVTNIGPAHVGPVGSVAGVAREKSRIFSRFSEGDLGFVYEGDSFRDYLMAASPGRVFDYGETTTPGYENWEDRGLEGIVLNWEGAPIRMEMIGEHNLRNALAAIRVSLAAGASEEAVRKGLESVRPLFGRSRLEHVEVQSPSAGGGGAAGRGPIEVRAFVDCYNANPASMEAALSWIRGVGVSGRRGLVVGPMKELGGAELEEHRRLGRMLADAGADGIFLYGRELEVTEQELVAAGYSGRLSLSVTIDELADQLRNWFAQNDLILIKGSRSAGLERVLDLLRA
ncbi:MAG: UDP-N-acetylmuramoyl-tripeptide--D-alanyl-D-alanine ligase [Spirochaetales bacterium]|nr:UDP-N-acetylmuramoyl-tripeptide--D-alanyl-D-alanine ligase [Spirochaetales bacterium]MCF7937632.1 UDP-N-acetylmuramoyl-tripeptide--D-alanyl-D-alanine ligase [Spirochaetales bacterium]